MDRFRTPTLVTSPAGTATLHQVDVIASLWASLALCDDALPGPDMTARYGTHWRDLDAIPDARDRIRRRMAGHQATNCLAGLTSHGAARRSTVRLIAPGWALLGVLSAAVSALGLFAALMQLPLKPVAPARRERGRASRPRA